MRPSSSSSPPLAGKAVLATAAGGLRGGGTRATAALSASWAARLDATAGRILRDARWFCAVSRRHVRPSWGRSHRRSSHPRYRASRLHMASRRGKARLRPSATIDKMLDIGKPLGRTRYWPRLDFQGLPGLGRHPGPGARAGGGSESARDGGWRRRRTGITTTTTGRGGAYDGLATGTRSQLERASRRSCFRGNDGITTTGHGCRCRATGRRSRLGRTSRGCDPSSRNTRRRNKPPDTGGREGDPDNTGGRRRQPTGETGVSIPRSHRGYRKWSPGPPVRDPTAAPTSSLGAGSSRDGAERGGSVRRSCEQLRRRRGRRAGNELVVPGPAALERLRLRTRLRPRTALLQSMPGSNHAGTAAEHAE